MLKWASADLVGPPPPEPGWNRPQNQRFHTDRNPGSGGKAAGPPKAMLSWTYLMLCNSASGPDYRRESLKTNPPASRRPAEGQILKLSRTKSGRNQSRKADFRPGKVTLGSAHGSNPGTAWGSLAPTKAKLQNTALNDIAQAGPRRQEVQADRP